MDEPIKTEPFAAIFKALAHPIRVLIVNALLEGEKCVLDIQELLQTSQPNVSQHLNTLRFAGIVDFHQRGNLRCYFLKEPERIRSLFHCLSQEPNP